MRIPFNRPYVTGNEIAYIQDVIRRGHASGDGAYTQRCNDLLERTLGARKVLLTTSCTHALEMAALLLDLRPGDEIIVPSFTFVSTVNAFVLRGVTPVFADIRPDTLNLDHDALENLITDRTKAIVPVHYAGVGCEMRKILEIARPRGIAVVEDNAHGLFAKYHGQYLGTFGCLATQSFHETKNISCGEGGALVINDPNFSERAEIIREKGTNRKRFFRGEVDKYTWVDIGSSYLPSEVLAAFLFAQLEAYHDIQRRRKQIWETYDRSLREWADRMRVGLPFVPQHCEQSYHMYYLLTPSVQFRQSLITQLKERGILSVFHYLPLHSSEAGKKYGRFTKCPITEDISDRIVRLPFYNDLTDSDQQSVLEAIYSYSGLGARVYAS